MKSMVLALLAAAGADLEQGPAEETADKKIERRLKRLEHGMSLDARAARAVDRTAPGTAVRRTLIGSDGRAPADQRGVPERSRGRVTVPKPPGARRRQALGVAGQRRAARGGARRGRRAAPADRAPTRWVVDATKGSRRRASNSRPRSFFNGYSSTGTHTRSYACFPSRSDRACYPRAMEFGGGRAVAPPALSPDMLETLSLGSRRRGTRLRTGNGRSVRGGTFDRLSIRP